MEIGKGHWPAGNGVQDGCKSSHKRWAINLDTLQEWQVFLTTELKGKSKSCYQSMYTYAHTNIASHTHVHTPSHITHIRVSMHTPHTYTHVGVRRSFSYIPCIAYKNVSTMSTNLQHDALNQNARMVIELQIFILSCLVKSWELRLDLKVSSHQQLALHPVPFTSSQPALLCV